MAVSIIPVVFSSCIQSLFELIQPCMFNVIRDNIRLMSPVPHFMITPMITYLENL